MTDPLKTQDPISVSRARLSFLPLAQPLPTHRHLVAPEQASCGDFIGIFGGVSHRPDLGLKPELFIDALSAAEEKRMKEITATPFAGIDPHRVVQQAFMAEKNHLYRIYLAQFSDAKPLPPSLGAALMLQRFAPCMSEPCTVRPRPMWGGTPLKGLIQPVERQTRKA